ncbi:MAG: hypothetical protein WB460_07845 [Candidatus Acidiferrales bacterium]
MAQSKFTPYKYIKLDTSSFTYGRGSVLPEGRILQAHEAGWA